jgi:hypothetical protein
MKSNEFLQILDELDEGMYDIKVIMVKNPADAFEIDILLKPRYGETDFIEEQWTITALKVRKATIDFELGSYLDIKDDHPVLWEYTDKSAELYISSGAENPEKVFHDLYHCHSELFEELVPFKNFLNNQLISSKILQSGRGLLARGPKKFIEKFASILASYHIKYSIYEHKAPTEVSSLSVLLINDSYIIAEDFNFQKTS